MTAAQVGPSLPTAVLDGTGVAAVITWFDAEGRDLPWRAPGTSPWAILVCEVMSHQTPVARIVEPWRQWLRRWPTPGALAADSPGEAVRMWGRLGYPRRALRLHQAASAMVERHGAAVPASLEQLSALPGIGPYTAAATASFGFGIRTPVLDVNIRRVLARTSGAADPTAGAPTRAERDLAADVLPADPDLARRWNAAVMELGALVCTARAPRCPACPLRTRCPGPTVASTGVGPKPRAQAWAGTDRQVRGLVMARLREAQTGVDEASLDLVWPDAVQLARCITSLTADGLAQRSGTRLSLPTGVGPITRAAG